MWILIFLSLFTSSGTLKGPSPEIFSHYKYYTRTQCDTDAAAINRLDIQYGVEGITLRAVCVPWKG